MNVGDWNTIGQQLEIVTFLLGAILVAICRPQKERAKALRWYVFLVLGVLFISEWRGVIALLASCALWAFVGVRHIVEMAGWWTLVIVNPITLILVPIFGRFLWLDYKDNRAIRAGSKDAFDRRVRDLMTSFNLSHEKAVEAAIKVRDERMK
jgi:hypothetical protein